MNHTYSICNGNTELKVFAGDAERADRELHKAAQEHKGQQIDLYLLNGPKDVWEHADTALILPASATYYPPLLDADFDGVFA